MSADVRIRPLGDAAWTIELPDRIDPTVNSRALELASRIEAAGLSGIRDIVVAYRTVTVFIDPLAEGAALMEAALHRIAAETPADRDVAGAQVEVPVCYDQACGPDLEDVAAFARCAVEDVIARHLALTYRVYLVGFVPGFAYMASVDPTIAAPRRSAPRLKVPAGSVAIAAGQTGIYPAETPGGWHIIGRTPVRPFDPERTEPFLFHPGDEVRFRRIDHAEFSRASQWEAR
jgi:inhibitor of KinA